MGWQARRFGDVGIEGDFVLISGFYEICTANSHLWRLFKVTSYDCPHIAREQIEFDREHDKESVFRIKHAWEWLYDAIIKLVHVRALLADPPGRNSMIPRGARSLSPSRI